MAQTIPIPGRRVSQGETFYTDWVHRGGDCVILRIEVLISQPETEGDDISFDLQTRGEDGTAIEPMTAETTSIEVDTTGIWTCLYLAEVGTTPGNGAQEQVRVRVSAVAGSGYYVVRIFPLIFFDSAKPY